MVACDASIASNVYSPPTVSTGSNRGHATVPDVTDIAHVGKRELRGLVHWSTACRTTLQLACGGCIWVRNQSHFVGSNRSGRRR